MMNFPFSRVPRRIALSLFVTLSQFLTQPAYCACNFINSQTAHIYTLTVPSATLSRDVPVGTVLSRSETPGIPASGGYANCSSPGTWIKSSNGTLISSTGDAYTYATGIDGVGVRFYDRPAQEAPRYYGSGNTGSYAGSWSFAGVLFGIEIVRTQPQGNGSTSGPTSIPATGSFSLDGLTIATIAFVPFDIRVSTCTISTPAIVVKMPRINVSQLPSVDSTAGNTDFTIGMNCDPGIKVAITMTDASNPGNRSTTMFLGPDSTALGIGYQIVNNGTAIGFGPDSSTAGTMNQFVIIPAAVAGAYSVVMTAQYIRTGRIVPGTANAYATFTLSYQ